MIAKDRVKHSRCQRDVMRQALSYEPINVILNLLEPNIYSYVDECSNKRLVCIVAGNRQRMRIR